ncbi:hypothetical protein NXC12_CH00299 [Rhizobium etli]|uniref:DUF2252 domain-containing protein n=1 Tax=Rhizobium etli TaxID=29449 RepID=A0AAN1EI63_RHIET|nr:hypothetical protein NXC12_CH00299 [Rhizobium etli]
MRSSAFVFLRATYWRWCETILDICQDLAGAPEVLAIGDTHLENFGTWRDVEGRLVWGVNDFDDAAVMPYALDLVRLAASAILARGDSGPSVRMIGELILTGYRRGLENPLPVILERDYKWLRQALVLPNAERREFGRNTRRCVPARNWFLPPISGRLPVHCRPAQVTSWRSRIAPAPAVSVGRVSSPIANGRAGRFCARRRRWCRQPGRFAAGRSMGRSMQARLPEGGCARPFHIMPSPAGSSCAGSRRTAARSRSTSTRKSCLRQRCSS